MISIDHFLVLALILFSLGLAGLIFRRNLIFVLMSVQLMLSGVNLIFIASSYYIQNSQGQVMATLVLFISLCQVAVGLAMVIAIYRKYKKIDLNDFRIEEEFFDYVGLISLCGIHYDFKSTRGAKAMEKKAKREKKLAERRAKRQAKFGNKKEEENLNKIKVDEPLSLDFITNPDKGK